MGVPDDPLHGSSRAEISAEGAEDALFAYTFPSYDPVEVAADRLVHIAGVCIGAIGAVIVVALATRNTGTLGIIAITLYAASLVGMFGLSAAYNLAAPSHTREILRRLDHATIYILIAGTHSAITLGRIDTAASRWFAVFAWGVALVGATIKIAFPRRFERAAVGSYVALGAIVFLSLFPLIGELRPGVLPLVGVGSVLYASGVGFHLWDSLRFQNAIWHAIVLCAACCHYVAIVLNM